ncbi:META domain-containing protein [Gulosibacter molinativorax]|uniref:META domain-containing protein n=1 Tax=Gulosibacter molinativorax TaxID=256821 RepID=A0ABT7C8G0_9MICO|nr:META domain-containing protein [Gulosibacter molinativorax]MDJ1371022.1 META domain-containing protein [Gulosibacter molinativorax]QUY62817.1 Hypotetical protein [Gulosibacter molinativorax]
MSHSPGEKFRRTLAACAAALAAIFVLVSCSGSSTTGAPSPIGFWGSEVTDSPNLSFQENKVSGTDGCNRLSGSWSQDASGRIHFEEVVSTEMYCDWVNTWLSGLDSAIILENRLHVFNAAGVEIGTLERN